MTAHSRVSLPTLDRVLRRDRAIVLGAIGTVTGIAAAYTVFGVGMEMTALEMTRMAGGIGGAMDMGASLEWGPAHAAMIVLMWWIMMIAMMTPSAAPTLLLFAALRRGASQPEGAGAQTLCFLAGYLLVWALFSVAATALQWGLQSAGLISATMMTVSSVHAAGAILILAGAYQFSSLKTACLRHCRSPARFLTEHRRSGSAGALVMGAHHGAFCLGCCWALMALLFVGGVMNLYWILGVALLVAIEKAAPFGVQTGRIIGLGLASVGAWILLTG
jgi:predicted metal-binding membrane protein